MKNKTYINFRSNWNLTRKNYIEWVAKNKLKKFCLENCQMDGFSIWWATKIVSKDNVNYPNWYIDLKKIFTEKNYQIKKRKFFWLTFFLKFIKNFTIKILCISFIKIICFTRYNKYYQKNLFHSYDYDFSKKKDKKFSNNLYGKILESSKKKNLILLTVIKFNFFFKNLFYFKKIRNLVFIDEYVSLKDLMYINFYSLYFLFKLIRFTRKNKDSFIIKNLNCENILKPLLFESFCGEIQNSYVMAKSIFNFMKKHKVKKFITYGEFTPGYRLVYFFVKKIKPLPKVITFQHGHANSLFNFHEESEFAKTRNKFEGILYSPCPDIYFVQGSQFFKRLQKFFKRKIKIIGAPRYDNFDFKKIQNFEIKELNKNKKNLLICTSIGDHEYIIDLISKTYDKKFNYILSPHPDNKSEVVNFYKKKYQSKFNFYLLDNFTTKQLINVSDLVITGLSNSCLESQFFGVPSLRVANPEKPDYLDHKEKIKIICTVQELKKILNKSRFTNLKIKKLNVLEKNYFFKFDNKAYKRFWKYS